MLFETIVVGSGSVIKKDAVIEAFGDRVKEVLTVNDTESGVSAQPVGWGETTTGAQNRAVAALERTPAAEAAIGIENGMMRDDGVDDADDSAPWFDAAVIVMLVRDKSSPSAPPKRFISTTAKLQIPPEEELRGAKFNIPKGKDGCWSALKDPHAVISGRPRKEWLKDALVELVDELRRLL